MKIRTVAGAAAALTTAAGAVAQPVLPGKVVVPRAFANVVGPSATNTLIRNSGNPRTFQTRFLALDLAPAPSVAPAAQAGATGAFNSAVVLDDGTPRTYQFRVLAADLAGVPIGSQIDRLAFRLNAGPAIWPATSPDGGGVRFEEYQITLSGDLNPGAGLSANFANNQLNPVLVRRGPLVIPPETYTGGTTVTVQPFGRDIVFGKPYTYTGGNILLTIRHTGSNEATNAPAVDAVSVSGNAVSVDSFNAVTGTLTGITPIVRFTQTSVPVGAEVTGVRWRLAPGSANWPVAVTTWADYEMVMAEDSDPANPLDATFANNELRGLLVRDGQLALGIDTFQGGAGLNPFQATPIAFNTRNFVYPGGNMIFRAQHPGSDQAAATPFLDAVSAGGLTALSFGGVSGTASAQPIMSLDHCPTGKVTVPLRASNFPEAATVLNSLQQTGQRKYQVQIAASQLVGLKPGDIITHIESDSNNANSVATWPPVDATYQNFDVTMSQAANPIGAISDQFASNQLNPVLVRSGPLTIPAGTFNLAENFDTALAIAPYQYMGGDLVVTFAHTGHNAGSAWFSSALQTSEPALMVSRLASNYSAVLGSVSGNGPMHLRFRTRPPADPDVLWTNGDLASQKLSHVTGQDVAPFASPAFGYSMYAPAFQLADNFTLADPRGSRVTGVRVYGYRTGAPLNPSPFTGGTFWLWKGFPRAAGSEVVATGSDLVRDEFIGAYVGSSTATDRAVRRLEVRLDVPQMLSPGAYWLSYELTRVDANLSVFSPALIDTCGRRVPGNGAQAAGVGAFVTIPEGVEFGFEILGAPIVCPADVDGSGVVDLADYFVFFNCFDATDLCADIDLSGEVDLGDYFAFFAGFDVGC